MALITEDGSGKADAESFASVADADAWHAARGNAAWAALTAGEKEINLRKATDYMQQSYRSAWAGQRVTSTQALDWPRYDVPLKDLPGSYYPSDTVPAEVRNACIMLALKASTILQGDQQAYLSAVGLTMPKAGDVLVWQGSDYQVIAAKELAPAGVNVLAELQVRK